jgi:TonB-linked SusC/RagA family outer membrane protein
MKVKLQPKHALLFLLMLFCLINVYGQETTVKGVVNSAEDGSPIPGVSVVVQGTGTGTQTDSRGRYSLRVPNLNQTLVFSYTGMVTYTAELQGKSTLDIRMEQASNQLSDVVVTAFGIKRAARNLGYSVQVVGGEQVSKAKELNVINSLSGQVAGVQVNPSAAGPAGSSFVVIRGNSSLTGTNQPLYVVDGVPIDNETLGTPSLFGGQRDFGDGIGGINPDDIESVSVLKGPAAASLYGARGAHGVIVITSKRGRAGKMAINYNNNTTVETLNSIPKFQNSYGGGYDDNYTSFDQVNINGQTVSQWPSWLQDNWGGKYDGRMISINTWPELGLVPFSPKAGDNFKKFYRTGITETNTLGVSGGNERITYRLSVTDLRNQGIVPNNSLNRQSVNLLINAKVTDRLTVEAKANYLRQNLSNPPETGGSGTSATVALTRLPPFLDLDWLKNYKRADGSMINYKSGSPNNPYWLMNEVTGSGDRDRFIGYVLAKYRFTDWLSLQGRTATDFYYDTRFSKVGIGTPGKTQGILHNDDYRIKEDNSDVLLTAAGSLSKSLTGSLNLGANHRDYSDEHAGIMGSGFNIPNLYNISNAKFISASQFLQRKVMNSVYFSGELAYNNYLFLDLTGRNDWSSTLGMNNYSFFYPSVSSSFIFTDAFNMKSSLLSFGKLRASYAEAGNDANPYQTIAGYDLSTSTYNGQPEASISTSIPLLNLKNELTRSVEFGTELKFFQNRLGLDFTYYHSNTINQITPVDISPATGYATRLINAGNIQNQGVELMITATPVRTSNFSWNILLNASRNRSKVISLAPGIATLTLLDTYNGAVVQATPGRPYGEIVGTDYLRNDQHQIVLTATGGYQPGAEPVVLGNIQPDYLAGVTNTFNYKHLELSALIDIRQGGQVFSLTKYNELAGGTGVFTANRTNLIADGVIQQNNGDYTKSNIVLTAQDYYAGSGPWSGIATPMIISASYVSLRQVSLSYPIGRLGGLEKTILKTANLSITGRNLLYLYRDPQFKQMGISPETAFNTTSAAQGMEAVGIPTTRSFGINLSLAF